MRQTGYKQALHEGNFEAIVNVLRNGENYLSSLKTSRDGESILNSNRKIGFLGFIICIKNAISMFESLIKQGYLFCLSLHKLSQDHIELYFQMIRSRGGFNSNPTVRQFKASF